MSRTIATQSSVSSVLERDSEQVSNLPAGSTSTGSRQAVLSLLDKL